MNKKYVYYKPLNVDNLKQVDRDIYLASASKPETEVTLPQPYVPMQDLLDAFVAVMTRAKLFADHKVEKQVLSIRERMLKVLDAIQSSDFVSFTSLFTVEEGRMGVVVTFIAILELIRQSVLEVVQNEPYAPIYVKKKELKEKEKLLKDLQKKLGKNENIIANTNVIFIKGNYSINNVDNTVFKLYKGIDDGGCSIAFNSLYNNI